MREICTSGSEGGWGGKPPWSTRPPKRRPEPSPPRRVKVSAFQRQGLQPSWAKAYSRQGLQPSWAKAYSRQGPRLRGS